MMATTEKPKNETQLNTSTATRTRAPCLEGRDPNPWTIDVIRVDS